MSTAIATQNAQPPGKAAAPQMPEVMERVVAMGDLSRLTPEDRLAYYAARCEAAGLDPRTQPFQYLQLQGKLTLYATKTATDQLIAKHKLTVQIVSRGFEEGGIYAVQCRVTFPDGHSVEDVGMLYVPEKLGGENLANAYLKAVTKAKRRTVLSACGLGMLDETEVEAIPGAVAIQAAATGQIPPPDNGSGHGRGQYASEEQARAYVEKMEAYLSERNQRWFDRWTDELSGEVPAGVKELCNAWQADNHLAKWAVETGRLDRASLPEGGIKHRQIGRYTAIVYHRGRADQRAITKELERYIDDQEQRQGEALRKKYPELFADDPADDDAIDAESRPTEAGDGEEWPEGRE